MSTQSKGTTAIRPLLRKVGLDEKEIEVYLALLSLKMAKATAISKASCQSRSHTYIVLRSLVEMGLASEVERGKIIHFVAEPPERLLAYCEERERQMSDLKPLVEGALPLLQGMVAPMVGTPRVTMSSGMQAMREFYREILRKDYIGCFNPAVMYDAFNTNVMTSFFGKNANFRGRDLIVSNDAGKKYAKEMEIFEEHQVRFLPEGIDFQADIITFDDTIALFAYDEENTIVRIENQQLAQAVQAIFGGLWNGAS